MHEILSEKKAGLTQTLREMGLVQGEEEAVAAAVTALWGGSARAFYDDPEDQADYISRINVSSHIQVREHLDCAYSDSLAPPVPGHFHTLFQGALHGDGEGAQTLHDRSMLLCWEKALSDQSKEVQKVLSNILPSIDEAQKLVLKIDSKKLLNEEDIQGDDYALAAYVLSSSTKNGDWYSTGGHLYQRLVLALGGDGEASRFLSSKGLKGLDLPKSYLRARGHVKNSRKHVIFDDLIQVLHHTYYQFSGPQAENAPIVMLLAAWDLENAGCSPEQIRQRTGWFKGMDQFWRYEIDDSEAELTSQLTQFGLASVELERFEDKYGRYATVGDVLKHDKLYAAYPYIQNIPVHCIKSGGTWSIGQIGIGTRDLQGKPLSDQVLQRIVHHELQHEVQKREGFARGASLDDDSVQHRCKTLYRTKRQRLNSLMEKFPEAAKAFRAMNRFRIELADSYGEDWGNSASEEELTEYSARELNLLNSTGGWKIFDANLSCMYAASAEGHEAAQIIAYLDHAGEIEARDVESRIGLSAELRKTVPPALREDAIVVFDDVEHMYAMSPAAVSDFGCDLSEENRSLKEVGLPSFWKNDNDANGEISAGFRCVGISPSMVYEAVKNSDRFAFDGGIDIDPDTPITVIVQDDGQVDLKSGGMALRGAVQNDINVIPVKVLYKRGSEKIPGPMSPALVQQACQARPGSVLEKQMANVGLQWVGSALKAPNGKASGLTEHQWRLIRTPLFKEWFGDWESSDRKTSHALDENGEPVIVYRGEHGLGDGFQTRLGSFSFGSLAAANLYAENPNDKRDTPVASRVTPSFLSIRNPFIVNYDDPFLDLKDLSDALGEEYAWKIANRYSQHIEHTNNWDENFRKQYGSVEELHRMAPEKLSELYVDTYLVLDDHEVVQCLKAAGYDGAIHSGNGATALEPEYRIFDSSQTLSIFPVEESFKHMAKPNWTNGNDHALTFFRGVPSGAKSVMSPNILTWFSSDHDDALDYEPGHIVEAELRVHNPADLEHEDIRSLLKEHDLDPDDLFELTERGPMVCRVLETAGYDALQVDRSDIQSGIYHVAVFGADQIVDVGDYASPRVEKPQGSLSLTPMGDYCMSLFDSADRSTKFHESAHMFLEEMIRAVRTGKASKKCQKDFVATMEWLEVSGGILTREQHEKFARGFEAYLMKRESPPSQGVGGMFRRFAEWLKGIYKSYEALNVDVSPEVETVYERIIQGALDSELDVASHGVSGMEM